MGLNGSRRLFFRLLKLLTRETDESAFPNTSSVRSSAFQFIARSWAGPGRARSAKPSCRRRPFVTDRRQLREIPSSASKMTARLTNCPSRNDVSSALTSAEKRRITGTTDGVRRLNGVPRTSSPFISDVVLGLGPRLSSRTTF